MSPISLLVVMSDWSATKSTISAIAGLDMTMPGDLASSAIGNISFIGGESYFGGNLTAYVNNGTIPEARVDDMVTRSVLWVPRTPSCCSPAYH